MPKYSISLLAFCSYDYEIEAENEKDAIEQAKELHASQSPSENLNHMYDFKWGESFAEEITD